MIPVLKSEIRKLLTVRSTYLLTLLVFALVSFIAFYGDGWRFSTNQLQDPQLLTHSISGAVLGMAAFGAMLAVLHMGHEYRYNTIIYTLTLTNSRSRVLLAKIIAISCLSVLVTLFIASLSLLMTYLGIRLHGHSLAPQVLHIDLLWRVLFYGWSYSMVGLLLAVIVRNQGAAIAALLITPTLEQLSGLLLRANVVYLPFTALSQVLQGVAFGGGSLTPGKAVLVVSAYLVTDWIIAWVLFLCRDAS